MIHEPRDVIEVSLNGEEVYGIITGLSMALLYVPPDQHELARVLWNALHRRFSTLQHTVKGMP